jgi:hypothetical protein
MTPRDELQLVQDWVRHVVEVDVLTPEPPVYGSGRSPVGRTMGSYSQTREPGLYGCGVVVSFKHRTKALDVLRRVELLGCRNCDDAALRIAFSFAEARLDEFAVGVHGGKHRELATHDVMDL